jgi:arsenite-transporting ATPase
VAQLADPARTTVVLVSRPETAALREAERTREELAALGVRNLQLALNGILAVAETDDMIAGAMMRRGAAALAEIPPGLAALPVTVTPLLPLGTLGLEALRQMANPALVQPQSDALDSDCVLPEKLSLLVDELAQAGRGVILTMGKGGVGKTTLAAAIAVALARRGHPVHLSTTDPAAHVAAAIGESIPGLSVSRIDPAAEVAAYQAEVLAKAAANLDPNGRAMLEEDLRSPCTEEIAVFRAFARAVDGGQDGFVVLDTAPTGHTILLLDAAEAYHREVSRTQGDMPEAVRQLLPRLRDPAFTRVLVVTLPEATPVHEAERLQQDLRRAGIEPFGWVVNQSLLASGTRHPLLRQRGALEPAFIRRVADRLSRRCALVPWLPEPPVGANALSQLTR